MILVINVNGIGVQLCYPCMLIFLDQLFLDMIYSLSLSLSVMQWEIKAKHVTLKYLCMPVTLYRYVSCLLTLFISIVCKCPFYICGVWQYPVQCMILCIKCTTCKELADKTCGFFSAYNFIFFSININAVFQMLFYYMFF